MIGTSSTVSNSSMAAAIATPVSAAPFSSPFTSQLNFNLPVKLDRNNYIFWRAQVLPAIRAYNLEEYVFETKPAPAKFVHVTNPVTNEVTTSLNNDFLVWKKNDQLLVCWLISTLSESVIGQVIQYPTAFQVWTTLEKTYSQQSRAKVLHLKSLIQSTRKGSMSMTDYVLKIKSYADSLSAVGHQMDDQDILLNVLNGLGNEYDSVVVCNASNFS
ncbi:hypothetical protein ACOSQ3_019981 [Xanthoceras sorbifolium]